MTVWDQLVQTAPEESRNVRWMKSREDGGRSVEVLPPVPLVKRRNRANETGGLHLWAVWTLKA